ncbi:MAG: hypothetical protein DME93_10910 [Verrucomicrobia bacterium]|nr:MAG: hypothetical protein DME93_10910 [Verrucomicrobiota bacterium]
MGVDPWLRTNRSEQESAEDRDRIYRIKQNPFCKLKLALCPSSLVATLPILPSMSLIPFAPFCSFCRTASVSSVVIKQGETLFALSGIQPKTRNHPPRSPIALQRGTSLLPSFDAL